MVAHTLTPLHLGPALVCMGVGLLLRWGGEETKMSLLWVLTQPGLALVWMGVGLLLRWG